MPYIKHEDRADIDCEERLPDTRGELNYRITSIIWEYMNTHTRGGEKMYDAINDVLGALEGAKLEFYRRVAAPYEDTKIKENGDVYV